MLAFFQLCLFFSAQQYVGMDRAAVLHGALLAFAS
jgi:hypothetical protein